MNRDFRFRRRMSWPLSAKHAELDSRQARMAVSDTSAQRAYSAIWPTQRMDTSGQTYRSLHC
jgi:hypothetical protein